MNNSHVQPELSLRGRQAGRQQIGYLMQQGVDYPDCLSLAAGLVDYATLPVDLVRTQMEKILSDGIRGRQALQYGTTEGSVRFRDLLIQLLAGWEQSTPNELDLRTDRCLVTTGSQQLLDLVSQALFNPGDICLVTAPSYFVYLSTLEGIGVDIRAVDSDEQGILPDALEEMLKQIEQAGELAKVKLLYLVSYFDNPAGITMPLKRREAVLEILERWTAKQYIYLLEDAAYRELWFHEPPPVSMYALDSSRQRVILAQTFSKSLSPGIRTGFGILPDRLVKAVTDLKSIHDFGSPHLTQFVIGDLIENGDYESHVASLRESYRVKAEALWEAVSQTILPQQGMVATEPQGGLYIWLKVDPQRFNSQFEGPLFQECVENQQVMFVPGELFYTERSHPDASCTMRLSYGIQGESNLHEGILRLNKALQQTDSTQVKQL